jgi:hypothetical protein
MSIQTGWDDTQLATIRLEFRGRWTIAELRASGQQVGAMAAAVGRQVGVIIHFVDGEYLPDRLIDALVPSVAHQSLSLRGVRYFVVVGSTPFGRSLLNAFMKIYRNNKLVGRVAFAATLDEARDILAKTPADLAYH